MTDGKQTNRIAIRLLVFLIAASLMFTETVVGQDSENKPKDIISLLRHLGIADTVVSELMIKGVVGLSSKDLQHSIQNKTIDELKNKTHLTGLALPKISMGQLLAESKSTPAIISPSILKETNKVNMQMFGVSEQIFLSRTNFGAAGFNDFSFSIDPQQSYKKATYQLTNEYSKALHGVMQQEITSLTHLKNVIENQVNIKLDSALTYLHEIGYSNNNFSFAQLNLRNIKSGYNAPLTDVENWMHINQTSISADKFSIIKRLIEQLDASSMLLKALDLDSIIKKYQELTGAVNESFSANPGRLKKFIKSNHIPGGFNFLYFFKNIDLGNLFNSKGQRSMLPVTTPDAIQGLRFLLNNKSNIGVNLGVDLTDAYDRLWQPNGLQQYKASQQQVNILRKLNFGADVNKIEALGGIGASFSQSTSSANSYNSFFGLDRIFKSFTVSKNFETKNASIQLNANTRTVNYIQSTNIKNIPFVPANTTSIDFGVLYDGNFKDYGLDVRFSLRGAIGSIVTTAGSKQTPGLDADILIRKQINSKLVLSSKFIRRKYDMGVAHQYFLSQVGGLSAQVFINRKNILNVELNNSNNSYIAPSSKMKNDYTNIAVMHNAAFKKHALKYVINTQVKIGMMFNNLIIPASEGKGWLEEVQNISSITYPSRVTLENTIVVSLNSYANNIFLSGNRFSVQPGVRIAKKSYAYHVGIVYEAVQGFYQQGGIKTGIELPALANRIWVSGSVDARYNLKEYQKVFNERLICFGSAGLHYSINK